MNVFANHPFVFIKLLFLKKSNRGGQLDMRITILGGGNMGMLLATKFSQNNNVCLYVNNPSYSPDLYQKDMVALCDNGKQLKGNIRFITNDLEVACDNAEWLFITFPAFMFEEISKRLIPLLKKGQHLVGIPGSGGFELFFQKAIDKGCTITGLQRVHSVARIIEKGKMVKESGVRKELKCATIPSSFAKEAATILSSLYQLPVIDIGNYLNITLVNSNPILHTSRLYSIFTNKKINSSKEPPLFYEEWDNKSSILLEHMDRELFEIIELLNKNRLKIDSIESILKHYDSIDSIGMTNKIKTIESLKGLKTPFVVKDGEYFPDLNSRYFTADFPFGLDILLSFANILNTRHKKMEMVSNWYHSISNDSNYFSLPAFGISSLKDVLTFYQK